MSLTNKTSFGKTNVVVNGLINFPQDLRLTITSDNGLEMVRHEEIAKILELKIYFCHAYHSWEKGTVENTNGKIRRFIPKGESLDCYTSEEIKIIEWHLNNTPKKCLDYLTPYEKMAEVLNVNYCTSR